MTYRFTLHHIYTIHTMRVSILCILTFLHVWRFILDNFRLNSAAFNFVVVVIIIVTTIEINLYITINTTFNFFAHLLNTSFTLMVYICIIQFISVIIIVILLITCYWNFVYGSIKMNAQWLHDIGVLTQWKRLWRLWMLRVQVIQCLRGQWRLHGNATCV